MTSPLTDEARTLSRDPQVETLLRLALEEDVGDGDVTTELLVPHAARARARIEARAPGVICGLAIGHRLLELAGADLELRPEADEGEPVAPGRVVAHLEGRARDLLTHERVLLNLVQRLSGIATTTRRFVAAVAPHPCAILETRKTVPGWRRLDKFAVRAGGGANHRMGLFDQILAKENHFALAARDRGLAEALADLLARRPPQMIVEVEVENRDEFATALAAGVDIILLDDMSLDDMRASVLDRDASRAAGRPAPRLEASGGIDLGIVAAVAATGVDRISVGALTHSVRALDLSLLVER